MLIWISEPSVAIGIFALLVLLCAFEGAPISTTSSSSLSSAADSDSEKIRISDLPFANSISHPCNPGTSRNNDRKKVEHHLYAIAFYRYMAAYSTLYKQDAQRVANESTMNDCEFLNLPTIQNTPNLSELVEMDAEEALKRIHSSLLMHAAYAYFVDHQVAAFSGSCSETSVNIERNFAKEALVLARKQKHMACMIQMRIEELGFPLNATNSLLNERFTKLRTCSRRALRDCQIMMSISHLLDVIANYSKSMLESMDIN